MLNVIEYLQNHSFEDLSNEFGIRVKEYDSGLVCLNYDQIESPRFHPIADECRGLIVDRDTKKVVSKSFNRFYNAGEGDQNNLDNIDLTDYVVMEKADGSIIKIYNHNGRWEISTRSTAYAESENNITGKTFRQMVLEAMKHTEEEFQIFCNENFSENATYVFEYISPFNRIVTPYSEDKLVLLGIVFNEDGAELDFAGSTVGKLNRQNDVFRAPEKYLISSKKELEETLAALEGLKEGFVLHNPKTGHRVKLKNLQYLKAHRIKGENGVPTRSDIAELVVQNETAEILAYFPEFKPLFEQVESVYHRLTTDAEELYNKHKDIEAQKDFAMAIKSHPLSSCMFEARAKKVDIKHAIATAKTTFLVKTILANVQ